MKHYIYEGPCWKVLGTIREGTVFSTMVVKEEHKIRLRAFVQDVMECMEFTSDKGPVRYEFREEESGYSIQVRWTSNKRKAEIALQYLEALRRIEHPEVGNSLWEYSLYENFSKLLTNCIQLDFSMGLGLENRHSSKLVAWIAFENLVADADEADIYGLMQNMIDPEKAIEIYSQDLEDERNEKEDQEIERNRFVVPEELLSDSIVEICGEALFHFGKNHAKVIRILEPLAGKTFIADYLLGATYCFYLKNSHEASKCFNRALKLMKEQENGLAASIWEYKSTIIFLDWKDPVQAEQSLMRSMFLGSKQSCLKLAYQYLQQARLDKKNDALSLVKFGEQILPYDLFGNHQRAGYHIVASVYLWNGCYQEAAAAHAHFLSSNKWCKTNAEFVESYFLFAVAVNASAFILSMIKDYPKISNRYSLIIDTWLSCIVNPTDPNFNMYMVPVINRINEVRRIYGIA